MEGKGPSTDFFFLEKEKDAPNLSSAHTFYDNWTSRV